MLHGLGLHGPTGVAAGRPRPPSPVLRPPLLQRAPEETRRGTDERPRAGLPGAAAPLTVSPPPLLLAVPRPCLGPWPALARDEHDP